MHMMGLICFSGWHSTSLALRSSAVQGVVLVPLGRSHVPSWDGGWVPCFLLFKHAREATVRPTHAYEDVSMAPWKGDRSRESSVLSRGGIRGDRSVRRRGV